MSENHFQIALLQQACADDAAANLEKVVVALHAAADAGARLICTQELFRSRYFCQSEDPGAFDLAEPVPGPTTRILAKVARERQVVVIAGLFERRARGVYHNTAAVIDADGSLAGIYRKMHLPDDPQFHEKFYFSPGDAGFTAFDTAVGRVAVLICWDQWYPEAARLAALDGADVLVFPSAIGWLAGERDGEGPAWCDAWLTMHRAHAIANGVYVAAVNRTGHEASPAGGIQFWGRSCVIDPVGRVVAEASPVADEIVVARVDPSLIERVRREWPFLRDRRIDAYAGLAARFLGH
ncbi:MAG: carbon-nitrogen hydrolase [Acidobacteriota bacterium]